MRKTYFESAPAAAPNPIDFPALGDFSSVVADV